MVVPNITGIVVLVLDHNGVRCDRAQPQRGSLWLCQATQKSCWLYSSITTFGVDVPHHNDLWRGCVTIEFIGIMRWHDRLRSGCAQPQRNSLYFCPTTMEFVMVVLIHNDVRCGCAQSQRNSLWSCPTTTEFVVVVPSHKGVRCGCAHP